MATVLDILSRKGHRVHSIGPEASVLDAATLMNEHKIGALVVLDQDRVVGMFTERDVLRRVVGEQREPARTRVSDVMTSEVACATPATSVEEARTAMMTRRIRHLPVMDGDSRLVGLVSIGDLNAYQTTSQEQTIFLMEEYLYGRV